MSVKNQLTKDELTLHFIATGLMNYIQQHIEYGNPIKLPYPAPLQKGLNMLVLLCLERNRKPPQGIPEVISWCQDKAIPELGLNLPSEFYTKTDRLLNKHFFTVTGFCEDWACVESDVEDELTEQALLRDVIGTCRERNSQLGYEAFRRLFIEKPVITELELHQLRIRNIELSPLMEQIKSAYEPASPVHCFDGHFFCCSNCGSLLLKDNEGNLICEHECCPIQEDKTGRKIRKDDGVLSLKRGLKRYITLPGLAELRLVKKLKKLKLEPELWPNFDSYDLRIVFPDNEAWAVDVKDWSNPFLLARRAEPFSKKPPWTKAWFVFPNERKKQRPDYLRAFRNYCSILDKQTKAEFENQFIIQVKNKLRITHNA